MSLPFLTASFAGLAVYWANPAYRHDVAFQHNSLLAIDFRASQADIANRYGLYLDYLQRNSRLDTKSNATILITADSVQTFIVELQTRVRPVTVWNSV